MDVLQNMTMWHWLIAAAILLILEVAAPGAVFLWMGLAAAVVGLLMAVLPIAWPVQWILFAVFSIACVFGWRAYKRARPDDGGYPNLNQRGRSLVGRRFTLSEPIVNERGRVNVDDSLWKIRGPDAPAGADVMVREVDGTVLVVDVAPPS